jgi:hypothetical protein
MDLRRESSASEVKFLVGNFEDFGIFGFDEYPRRGKHTFPTSVLGRIAF